MIYILYTIDKDTTIVGELCTHATGLNSSHPEKPNSSIVFPHLVIQLGDFLCPLFLKNITTRLCYAFTN